MLGEGDRPKTDFILMPCSDISGGRYAIYSRKDKIFWLEIDIFDSREEAMLWLESVGVRFDEVPFEVDFDQLTTEGDVWEYFVDDYDYDYDEDAE